MIVRETFIIEVELFESVESCRISINAWKDSKLLTTKTVTGQKAIALYTSIKAWKEKYGT